ncbi:MAG TPA: hypothetical protein VH540_18610 [Ktedonobacterales bacterium]|jgi:hypothetical protein
MGEVDQSFKRLFLLRVDALLEWLLGEVKNVASVPTDLATERQLLPDTLYRATFEGIPCLINVEIQSEPDDEMPYRLYLYAARSTHEYRLPVISVVIWVFDRGAVPTPPYRVQVGSWFAGSWNYHSIKMYELDPQALLTAGLPGILPLVPLTRGATDADAEAAMQRLQQETPLEEAQSLGALLSIFYSQIREDRALGQELFRRFFMANIDNFVETNPILHDVWEKMIARGEAAGLTKGVQLAIRSTLEGRFGPLSQDVLDAINACDIAQLSEIARYAGTETLEQLRARLGLNTSA